MGKNAESDQLRQVLQQAYNSVSETVDVSPSLLATMAMSAIDPEKTTLPLVYLAAHLQLRQVGRSICRDWFEREEPIGSHSLFPDLQNRYPISRGDEEPVYRLLESLSDDDVAFNVKRLRSEASAKLKHADALEAWWQNGRHQRRLAL